MLPVVPDLSSPVFSRVFLKVKVRLTTLQLFYDYLSWCCDIPQAA